MKTLYFHDSTIFSFLILNSDPPDNFYSDECTDMLLNGACSYPDNQIFVMADNRKDPSNCFYDMLKASFRLVEAGCLLPCFSTNN